MVFAISRTIHSSNPSTGIDCTRSKSSHPSSHQSIPITPITSIKNSLAKHQLVGRVSPSFACHSCFHLSSLDSPGIPPSADAHDSFHGFSYIAPDLINARQNDPSYANDVDRRLRSIVGVKLSSFQDEYDLKEPLGHGKTSTCHRCVHRQTRAEYAVKIIRDANINDPSDEIELLLHYNQLTHIIRVWTRSGAYAIDVFRWSLDTWRILQCTDCVHRDRIDARWWTLRQDPTRKVAVRTWECENHARDHQDRRAIASQFDW